MHFLFHRLFVLAFVDRSFTVYNFRSRPVCAVEFYFCTESVVLVQDLGSGCKEYLLQIRTGSLGVVILAVKCRWQL